MKILKLFVFMHLVPILPLGASSLIFRFVPARDSNPFECATAYVSGEGAPTKCPEFHVTDCKCVHPNVAVNAFNTSEGIIMSQEDLSETDGAKMRKDHFFDVPERMGGGIAENSLRVGLPIHVPNPFLSSEEVNSDNSNSARRFTLPASNWHRQDNIFTTGPDSFQKSIHIVAITDIGAQASPSHSPVAAAKQDPPKLGQYVHFAVFSGTSIRVLLALGMFSLVFRHSR